MHSFSELKCQMSWYNQSMQFKAIISDFDGTLVDHTHTLSPKLKSAIQEFVSNGNIFSICTGRAYQGVLQKICQELGLRNLVIVRGGSEIIDPTTHSVVWAKYIEPETVSAVIGFLYSQQDLFFAAERGEFIYSRDAQPDPEFGQGADFKNVSDMPTDLVPKIVVPPLQTVDIIDALLDKLRQKFSDLHLAKITSRKGFGIDMNHAAAGKHMAVLEYAKLMQLDPKQLVAVGDSYNDYPMLTACGYKVAMGNAPEELLDIADLVVGTQTENGVLEVLRLFEK